MVEQVCLAGEGKGEGLKGTEQPEASPGGVSGSGERDGGREFGERSGAASNARSP